MDDDKFTYDIFLSYSSQDKSEVYKLAKRLRDDGLRVWLDKWQIKPGQEIIEAIENGLNRSRFLVQIMSHNGVGSEWAELERKIIQIQDPTNRQGRFIPLLLTNCEIPSSVKPFNFIDYRKTRETGYKQLRDTCSSGDLSLEIDSEFKVDGVADAAELLTRLRYSSATDWKKPNDLYDICTALIQILDNSTFKNTLENNPDSNYKDYREQFDEQADNLYDLYDLYNQLEESTEPIDPKIFEQLQECTRNLDQVFRKDLKEKIFLLIEKSRFDFKRWYFTENQFVVSSEFFSLPLTVRDIFEESGRCLIFKQFASCEIMSMCAVEAMFYEYYCRIKKEKLPEKFNWNELLQKLNSEGIIPKTLERKLESASLERDLLINPRKTIKKREEIDAISTFNMAQRIVLDLQSDLRDKCLGISVIVCLYGVSHFVSPDILISLWLFNRYKHGIGRLVFEDPDKSGKNYANVDFRKEYNESLGLGGAISVEVSANCTYSAAVAEKLITERLMVLGKHKQFLDYCRTWLESYNVNKPNTTSDTYVYTLEGIIKAVQIYYRQIEEPREDPLYWCKRLFKLFDLIDRKGVNPLASNVIEKVRTEFSEFFSELNEAIDSLYSSRQEQQAFENKTEIDYEDLKCIVTLIDYVKFDSFKEEMLKKGYELIALTDNFMHLYIAKKKDKQIDLKKILNPLYKKTGLIASMFEPSTDLIQAKQPVRLSVKELCDCVTSAFR